MSGQRSENSDGENPAEEYKERIRKAVEAYAARQAKKTKRGTKLQEVTRWMRSA